MDLPLKSNLKDKIELEKSNKENQHLKDLLRKKEEKIKALELELCMLKKSYSKINSDLPLKRLKKEDQQQEDYNSKMKNKKCVHEKTLKELRICLEYTLFPDITKNNDPQFPIEFKKFLDKINSLIVQKCPDVDQISKNPSANQNKKSDEQTIEYQERYFKKISDFVIEFKEIVKGLRSEYIILKNEAQNLIYNESHNTLRSFDNFIGKISSLEKSEKAKIEQVKEIYKKYEEANNRVNTLEKLCLDNESLHKIIIDAKSNEIEILKSDFNNVSDNLKNDLYELAKQLDKVNNDLEIERIRHEETKQKYLNADSELSKIKEDNIKLNDQLSIEIHYKYTDNEITKEIIDPAQRSVESEKIIDSLKEQQEVLKNLLEICENQKLVLEKKLIEELDLKSQLQKEIQSQELTLNHLANQNEMLGESILNYKEQLLSKDKIIESIKIEKINLDTELDKLNSLLGSKIIELGQSFETIKKLEDENRKLLQNISDLENNKNYLNSQLSEASIKITKIETALQDTRSQNSSLIDKISVQNHELSSVITDFTSKIQDLELEKQNESRNFNLQIETISKQNSDFISQKDKNIQELQILLDSRPNFDPDTEKMIQELNSLNLSLSQMRNQIEVYRKNNSELSNILAQKDKELKAIQTNSGERIKSLEIEILQRRLEIKALTKSLENTDVMNEIKMLYNSNEDELRKRNCELELEIKKIRNEEAIGLNYEDYQNIMKELKKENKVLREKLMLFSGFN